MRRIDTLFSSNDMDTIMHTELFRGTPESVLRRVLSVSGYELKRYEKDDTVYTRRSFMRSLGIVLEGSLRVTKENADGRAIVMSTLRTGQMFGAAAIYNEEAEYATELTATQSSRVIFFSQNILSRMMEREPRISENYIRYLSGRILFLNKKIYFLTSGTAEQRLSSYLMDNLSEHDDTELAMTMTQIASSLNISRASFYRALDAIVSSGAVIKSGRQMRIADASKLCDFIK